MALELTNIIIDSSEGKTLKICLLKTELSFANLGTNCVYLNSNTIYGK